MRDHDQTSPRDAAAAAAAVDHAPAGSWLMRLLHMYLLCGTCHIHPDVLREIGRRP